MSLFVQQIGPSTRPQKKNYPLWQNDRTYHIEYARYCTWAGMGNTLHQQWLEKIERNQEYYHGRGWGKDKEAALFLEDATGVQQRRLTLVRNIIRPLVEMYRASSNVLDFSYRAKGISENVANRREIELGLLTVIGATAKRSERISKILESRYPVYKDPQELQKMFGLTYQDVLEEDLNYLVGFIEEYNNMAEKVLPTAENMAFSGAAFHVNEEWNSHQRFRVVPSANMFWDRAAREYSLKDAGYWGEWYYMLPSEIMEMWPDTADSVDDLERAAEQIGNSFSTQPFSASALADGRLPVIMPCWRDSVRSTYGYVRDEFGYAALERIDHIYDGDDKPRYTKNDLIPRNELTKRQREVVGPSGMKTIMPDTLRYCHFIPYEVLPGKGMQSRVDRGVANDFALGFGEMEYQQQDALDPFSVVPPYSAYFWSYINGEVAAPIDDAIDPQKFVNRVVSIAEAQLNASGGKGVVIAEEFTDNRVGDGEMERNMKEGKPIRINTQGIGVNNAVGAYDTTPGNNMSYLFNIMALVEGGVADTTGISPQLRGQPASGEQLVGVTQALQQQGALMQQPFYNAVSRVFEQSYQAMAQRGKRIYEGRTLSMIVGDQGARIIKVTEAMANESFRVFMQKGQNRQALIQAGNALLLTMHQLQVIDQITLKKMYNQYTPDEIANQLKVSAAMQEKSAKEAAELQAEEQQKQNMLISSMIQRQTAKEEEAKALMLRQDAVDKNHDIKKIWARAESNVMRDALKPART